MMKRVFKTTIILMIFSLLFSCGGKETVKKRRV